MDRIISFLLFAALFYFMMRFGCGSHMVHGHHHHTDHDEPGMAPRGARSSKDLTWGMTFGTMKRRHWWIGEW
jgi:hypothetical protein